MSNLNTTIKSVLRLDYRTQHKPKVDLTPSSFPICPLVWFTKLFHQEQTGFHENKTGVLLNIFAEAGKGLHKHIQYGLGFSGRQFGHYYCDDYKCAGYVEFKFRPKPEDRVGQKIHWNTRNNICPHCGKGMQYLEVEIIDGELKMAIDTILLADDGRSYEVYDFKSTSVEKAVGGKSLNKINLYQVRTYVVEVIEHLHFDVSKYGLVYFPRDNPNKYVIFDYDVDQDMLDSSEKFLKHQYRSWIRAKASVHNYDFEKLYKLKLCKDKNDYFENYHSYDECPLLGFCTEKKAMADFFVKFMEYSSSHRKESWFDIIQKLTRNKTTRVSL